MAERIEIQTTEKSYPVVVGEALEPGVSVSEFVEPGECAILTDSNVGPLYANGVRTSLEDSGWSVLETLEIPAGESSKSLGAYADILRSLARAGLPRDGALFALGGGVAGDLGGFVAASYMRGVRLIMLPTTLLSMVDSSVGGKTGVDLPEGKNLVGAFFQPELVLGDLDHLSTLPEHELSNGLAEVIKMGLLAGDEYFADLLGVADALAGDSESLQKLIIHAIRYKAKVVEEDEREGGVRAVLNYGHTVGHAIEAVTGYGVSHGEAISAGMCAAARISRRKLGVDLVGLHEELLSSAGLPSRVPEVGAEEISIVMRRDKKRRSQDPVGEHRFVLLEEPGRPKWNVAVSDREVRAALEEDS